MGDRWPEAARPGGYGAAGILSVPVYLVEPCSRGRVARSRMPRRLRGGGYSERASPNSWSLAREEGGPEAAAHAATEPAGILSRAQPDRGNLGSQPDGQDLRSSGYGAAAILRRAIPSWDVQSAERTRFLGNLHVRFLPKRHRPRRSGSCRNDAGSRPKPILPKRFRPLAEATPAETQSQPMA